MLYLSMFLDQDDNPTGQIQTQCTWLMLEKNLTRQDEDES